MDINPHYKGGIQTLEPGAPVPDDHFPLDPAQPVLYRHRVSYLYNEQSRTHEFEYEEPQLPPEVAAMRLMEVHYGDGENNLLMPSADASADQIMDQANLMGISFIEIQSQGRVIGGGEL